VALVGEHLAKQGLVSSADAPFVAAAVELMQGTLELVQDATRELTRYVAYPLAAMLATGEAQEVVEDNFLEIAAAVVEAHESGALQEVRACWA
jgi:glutamyl-tRNA synthetase